jgi:hypothetical protein
MHAYMQSASIECVKPILPVRVTHEAAQPGGFMDTPTLSRQVSTGRGVSVSGGCAL